MIYDIPTARRYGASDAQLRAALYAEREHMLWRIEEIENDSALVAPPSLNWSFCLVIGNEKLDRAQSGELRRFWEWYPDYELRIRDICELLGWSITRGFPEWSRVRTLGLDALQATAGWRERGILQWLPKRYSYRGQVLREDLDVSEFLFEHIDNGERLLRIAETQETEDDEEPRPEPEQPELELPF